VPQYYGVRATVLLLQTAPHTFVVTTVRSSLPSGPYRSANGPLVAVVRTVGSADWAQPVRGRTKSAMMVGGEATSFPLKICNDILVLAEAPFS
jgi:hypothetical protein